MIVWLSIILTMRIVFLEKVNIFDWSISRSIVVFLVILTCCDVGRSGFYIDGAFLLTGVGGHFELGDEGAGGGGVGDVGTHGEDNDVWVGGYG